MSASFSVKSAIIGIFFIGIVSCGITSYIVYEHDPSSIFFKQHGSPATDYSEVYDAVEFDGSVSRRVLIVANTMRPDGAGEYGIWLSFFTKNTGVKVRIIGATLVSDGWEHRLLLGNRDAAVDRSTPRAGLLKGGLSIATLNGDLLKDVLREDVVLLKITYSVDGLGTEEKVFEFKKDIYKEIIFPT